MWQSRTPNVPNTFKQYSRLIHFCHTPLLFLPAWRLQSAATRDHSLTPPSSLFSLNTQQQQSPAQPKQKTANTILVKWHQELCKLMLSEYKQYLQILGFNPIQVESPHKTFVRTRDNLTNFLTRHLLQRRGARAAAVLLPEEVDAGRYFVVRNPPVATVLHRQTEHHRVQSLADEDQ